MKKIGKKKTLSLKIKLNGKGFINYLILAFHFISLLKISSFIKYESTACTAERIIT